MPRFSFQPLGDSWVPTICLLAALVFCVFFLAPKDPSLSVWRKRTELALRLAIVAMFAFFFARPSVVRVEEEELPASFAFLCDLSESMSICDGPNGESRYDAMRAAFDSAREPLKKLADRFDVRVLGFGDGVDELEFEDGQIAFPEKPEGTETQLGGALTDVLRSSAGKRLLGVAVLSDGAQRAQDADAPTPQDGALRARDAERPIYAVPFGTSGASSKIRDVAIADLRANDRVFLGNELAISGQVRLLGCSGREIPLELELESPSGEKSIVDQTTLTPTSDDATLPYQFVAKPSEPGEWKLRVSAPVQDGELLETNNELGSFAEAIDGGLDVLYVEGTRRYEQNFLRAALEDASDVRIRYWRPPTTSLVVKTPNATEAEMVADLAKSRKSLVEPFFSEGKYAAYALGDVDATAFQPDELKELANRVEQGAGLAILVGERSLGLGGYADTPLEKLLPTQVLVSERLPLKSDLASFDANAESDRRARLDGEFRALPAANGDRPDFMVRLNPDPKKNLEQWKTMPPLSDVYRIGALKPNAKTVLEAVGAGASEKSPVPLLVSQQYGQGRVVVVATDSTWRWRMRGKSEEHAKFWRQLFLWIAKMDELAEGELAVEMERSRFAPEENVEFRLAYRPKSDEDPTALKARAAIVAPDGTRETIELTEENGIWRGEGRRTSQIGDYRVEAEIVSSSGDSLQTARSRFLVYARNLELERPDAAPETLKNLAATTGGTTVESENLSELLEEIARQSETIVDRREVKRTLFDTRAAFIIFVALLTCEWILRKRWGLA